MARQPNRISTQKIAAATLNSIQSLTVPAGTTRALICPFEATKGSGECLFMTTDASDPSSTNGVRVGSCSPFPGFEYLGDVTKLKFINETSSAVRLEVTYFGD